MSFADTHSQTFCLHCAGGCHRPSLTLSACQCTHVCHSWFYHCFSYFHSLPAMLTCVLANADGRTQSGETGLPRSPGILACSGCYNKNTRDWMAYKEQKWLTVLEAGGPRSRLADSVSGQHWPLVNRWQSMCCVLTWKGRRSSLIRALIPIMRTLPSWSNCLPETPPPKAITLGIRFQHTNLVGWVGTQTLTLSLLVKMS